MGKRVWKNPTNRGHHPLYRVWHSMCYRCNNPEHPRWKDYGGRGITVCKQWLFNYDTFCADVGPHPGKGMTFDRIDNDGSYEPGNVRWVTYAEQARNSRHAAMTRETVEQAKQLRATGMSYPQIGRAMGIDQTTAYRAINNQTWTKD